MPKETLTLTQVGQRLDTLQREMKSRINGSESPNMIVLDIHRKIKRLMFEVDESSIKSDSGEPDWRSIPQIQSTIKRLSDIRSGEEVTDSDVGNWFREADKEYTLRVKVADVDVAQAVLTRAFSSIQLMPGMKILEVTSDPEGDTRKEVASRLRDLADKVERATE